jgi:hypothetical protein
VSRPTQQHQQTRACQSERSRRPSAALLSLQLALPFAVLFSLHGPSERFPAFPTGVFSLHGPSSTFAGAALHYKLTETSSTTTTATVSTVCTIIIIIIITISTISTLPSALPGALPGALPPALPAALAVSLAGGLAVSLIVSPCRQPCRVSRSRFASILRAFGLKMKPFLVHFR